MTNDQLPPEVEQCLDDLKSHYCDFEIVRRGASGFLWFAKNSISQAEVAIKFYQGESGEHRHDEPKLLSQIESPNILPIYDTRNVSDDWAYFITPRCHGGDVDDLIKSQPSLHEAIDTILGISHGVSEIHANRMVHRDLKPANIVMDGNTPRIADFGTVRVLDGNSTETSASQHSGLYRPPESFASNRYSRVSDVYQVGLVSYQLLGGVLHYDGREYLSKRERREFDTLVDHADQCIFVNDAIRRKAESGALADFGSLPPWIGSGAKRVLRRMIHPDPAQRMASMADVAAAMSQLRGNHLNWRMVGGVAQLSTEARLIELRRVTSNEYEAFQKKTGAFRRIPGMKPSTLHELVKLCSSQQ